jgi:hypothetical protein
MVGGEPVHACRAWTLNRGGLALALVHLELTRVGDGTVLYTRWFISVIGNGVRSEIEPIQLDGYVVERNHVSIAPDGRTLTVDCTLNPGYEDKYIQAVCFHPQ